MANRIELANISKDYGSTRALDSVSFTIPTGTIRGLVGENGAGKSTLCKIIAGNTRPTSGSMQLGGESISFLTPLSARKAGIGIVHQWGDLVPAMTVEENIFLGNESRAQFGILDKQEMRRRAAEVLRDLGAEIDLRARVEETSPAHRQIVAISKALVQQCDLLIIDEGGVSLDKKEASLLHGVVRQLRAKKVTIIYISHLLDEVIELSDEISVLRNGKYVATLDARVTTPAELARAVVGHDIRRTPVELPSTAIAGQKPVLEIRDLTWEQDGAGFSFALDKGEILGITGPEGAGKSELMRTLYGLMPSARGTVALNGERIDRRGPREMLRRGVAFVPEDRFAEGLLLRRSIEENISLPKLSFQKAIFLRRAALRKTADRKARQIKTKMKSIDSMAADLSGGNQQKVVVSRWLDDGYQLLLLDEPYKGIDIGAKEDINDAIRAMARGGRSAIVISTEFGELLGLVNTLLVIVNRRIVRRLSGEAITPGEIVRYYQSDEGSAPDPADARPEEA